jgi:aarF domain-containing kinase
MRRTIFLGLGGVSLASTAYVASNADRRRRVVRGVRFWSKAMPMYSRYRLEEFLVRNLSEEEKDKRFERLHQIWAPKALQDILEMRGLYIKLGQMMTTR